MKKKRKLREASLDSSKVWNYFNKFISWYQVKLAIFHYSFTDAQLIDSPETTRDQSTVINIETIGKKKRSLEWKLIGNIF